MITERKEDIALVEVDSFIEKMIAKYTKAFLGDRFGEVANGNLHDQSGRQPFGPGEEVGNLDQRDIGR